MSEQQGPMSPVQRAIQEGIPNPQTQQEAQLILDEFLAMDPFHLGSEILDYTQASQATLLMGIAQGQVVKGESLLKAVSMLGNFLNVMCAQVLRDHPRPKGLVLLPTDVDE